MAVTKRFVAAALAAALVLASGAAALAAATPAEAVKAYFNAAAKGDTAAMKALSGPKMSQDLPKPGSPLFDLMRDLGAAFTSVAGVQVKGDKAVAAAHFDKAKVKQAFEKAFGRQLALVKNPQQRAQAEARFKAQLPQMVEMMSTAKVVLAKKGAGWVLQDVDNKK